MNNKEKERLGKIVALAKNGIGGEKTAAMKVLKQLCKKYELHLDDVLNDIGLEDFHFDIKKWQAQLAVQIIARYAYTKKGEPVGFNRFRTRVFFKTTKEKYIETVNAFSILSRLYQTEQKEFKATFFDGFLYKHNLFYQMTPEEEKEHFEKQNPLTPEEREKLRLAEALAMGMKDAKLHKALKSGK